MERTALHLRVKDGMIGEYRKEHENVHDALEQAYLESGAGLERFSVFEKEGHVFVFVEAKEPDRLKEVMETSKAQAEWEDVMDGILDESAGTIWLDEVYRLI